MFYAIYMATRPRARIFHKTLGLMLYLLLIIIAELATSPSMQYRATR